MAQLSKKQRRDILWNGGQLLWKLHSAQQLIYKLFRSLPSDQREALIFCGRGFGKSYLGITCALEDCLRNPNVQVAIVGPSITHTKAIVTPLIKQIIADAPAGLIKQYKTTTEWHFSNGSILSIGGFDTALESFRGRTLFNIYMEETGFSTADYEEYIYILYSVLMSTLRSRVGARLTHFTTPSKIVDHPLHLETLPKCKLNNAFYLYTIEQNPMLTPEQIALEIQTLGGRESTTVKRELYCEIVRDDSITVVPQFDEARHVGELKHGPYRYLVSGDLGYTNDLSAFHLMAYDHTLGRVCVLAEKVFPPTTTSKSIVDALQDWAQYSPAFVVDIQGNTRVDMSSLGLATAAPVKDKFESTITFIRNAFYQDTVLIDPACSHLIQTLRSLTFNKQRTDFLRTTTLGHGDSLMSLVYGLRSVDRVSDLRPKPSAETVFRLKQDPPHIKNIKGLSYSGK